MKLSKSENSIGLYGDDLHVIFFRPRNDYGNSSSWGFHVRRRVGIRRWRHYILRLFERSDPIPGGIGCWKWEAQQYDTKKASSDVSGNRLTIKKFIRIKVGLGGEKPRQ